MINEEKLKLYSLANHLYHSGEGESPLSDTEFDLLEQELAATLGPEFIKVGAKLKGLDKVKLPQPMGSLEKIRPGGVLASWLAKIKSPEIVLMDKVDGSSIELLYVGGALAGAYTRGDGFEGKPVERHCYHIPNLPKIIPVKDEIVIRAEVYMPDPVFQEKFKNDFKNSRNIVAGIINRKESSPLYLNEMRVTAYHIYKPFSKEDMLFTLEEWGFETPYYRIYKPEKLSDEMLSELLKVRRATASYAIDGLVLEVNPLEERNELGFETNSLNPAFARAFKTVETEDKAETEVVAIHWAVSKDGYLKPRIEVQPTELAGVTVTHATAFNAAYIRDNNINTGARVLLTRSGDVIPYILEVVKPAATPSLPSVVEFGSYHWNESNVDLITDEETEAQKIEKLIFFFTALDIEFFSDGLIQRFYEKGFTSVEKILCLSVEDMMMYVGGVQEKMAGKIHASIWDKLKKVPLPKLMAASGYFGRGFGETRSIALLEAYPDLMTWDALSPDEMTTKVCAVHGFSEKTASGFVSGYHGFKKFLAALENLGVVLKVNEVKSGALLGKVFCFTGFRDKIAEDKIVELGGKISSSVTKSTTHLIIADLNSGSQKLIKAKKQGATVIEQMEFYRFMESNC